VKQLKTLAILVCALIAAPVLAAPTPEMLEQGKKEFEAGSRDFDLGNYDKALEHFEAAYKLTGKAALLFNIARVHEFKYRRAHTIAELEAASERLKSYLLLSANDVDPPTLALRQRAEAQLKANQDELAKEHARRARGEEALQVGEEALEAGRFADAQAQYDKFIATSGNERPGLVRAYSLRALIAFATKDEQGTIDWFARALSLDKGVALPPRTIARLQRLFEGAKQRLAGKEPENVAHTPPGGLKPGQSVELSFPVASDPEHLVAQVLLYYRLGGGRAYSKVTVGPNGRALLPALFTQQLQAGMKIEYYADVLDKNGAYLEHIGTADVPFSVLVGKLAGPSIAKKWWLWTVVGVVVAGAAVGAGLGWYYSQPKPAPEIPINTGQQALGARW
jgi:tetratricopeptide (TPR) repeat protein